jgi:hypothetical protein
MPPTNPIILSVCTPLRFISILVQSMRTEGGFGGMSFSEHSRATAVAATSQQTANSRRWNRIFVHNCNRGCCKKSIPLGQWQR